MRAPLAAVLLLVAAGCVEPSYDRPPDETSSLEIDLEEESYYVAQFEADGHVRLHVRVLSGGPVDVWLARDCQGFTSGSMRPIDIEFGVTETTMDADFAGPGCMPIDNADIGEGTTASQGPVRVNYTIELWR